MPLERKRLQAFIVVGDPEQYIQSFDSTIKNFTNIPILKASNTGAYELRVNDSNYRSTESITTFLNHFNGRVFSTNTFNQSCKTENAGESVKFIDKQEHVSDMISLFLMNVKN